MEAVARAKGQRPRQSYGRRPPDAGNWTRTSSAGAILLPHSNTIRSREELTGTNSCWHLETQTSAVGTPRSTRQLALLMQLRQSYRHEDFISPLGQSRQQLYRDSPVRLGGHHTPSLCFPDGTPMDDATMRTAGEATLRPTITQPSVCVSPPLCSPLPFYLSLFLFLSAGVSAAGSLSRCDVIYA